jgi:dihydropyrimidine dehydrogenase (NAD+) subunit PreA
MADLSASFLGIRSPNPFWLASAPPTDKQYNVIRAFEAGWGGVVWKTLGPQIKNVSSRYSAVNYNGGRVMGFNNIELISDRPLHINLAEIKECLRLFPDRAMVVSLMADNDRESWHELIKKVEDTGAHGLELNFGCPHGMTERGMGATVGQDPEIARMVVEWVMEKATIPVITKLTPNVHSPGANWQGLCAGRLQRPIADQYDSVCHRHRPGYPGAQPVCCGQIGVWRLLRSGC